MFTVKVYRRRPIGDPGRGIWDDRVTIYEARSVDVENSGITLHGLSNAEDEAWVPYPNVEAPPSDDDDVRVTQVIIENASGKTTEVIRG